VKRDGQASLKIVQVCGWYFPDSLGGTETYVSALASGLRTAGHEVAIAVPDPGAPRERTYQHDGFPVFRYPIPARPTRDEAQHVTAARGAERLHAWLGEMRPDVVHFHTFVTGVGPHEIRAARAAGARVIATTHSGSLGFLCQRGSMMRFGRAVCDGVVSPATCAACELQHRGMPRPFADLAGLVPAPIGGVLSRMPGKAGTTLGMRHLVARNRSIQADMLAHVDRFVVLTEWARRATVANDGVGAPIVLNRLGIRATAADVQQWRATPRQRRKHLTVAYLGRFDRIKGVHDLARAIRGLGEEVPIRVEFRGPVSNLRELEISNELKAIVGPDAWVQFLPPVDPAGVFAYLHGVDVLCCPSLTLEGGPTVALEAMAVGTPVVATRIGAMAETIDDGVNGRLVPPGDWRALAQALRDITKDPAVLDRWRRALPPIRTMDHVVEEYLRLYGA
jgi:glycosyltransferase involved in cell wall biosynthesis